MYGGGCQRGAEVHVRFTVACVKHAVNINLPSAGAVQMLSEKKRIRAKLGGGGAGVGGEWEGERAND